MNLGDFFGGVLAELGELGEAQNSRFILGAFAYSEYGQQNALERWNPLNTTLPWDRSGVFNSVGVRIYATARDGIDATARTLQNGYYPQFVANLKANAGVDAYGSDEIAKEFRTWQGGSDLALHCVHSFTAEFVQNYLNGCTRDDGPPQPQPAPPAPPTPDWLAHVKWGGFSGSISATAGANVRGGPGVDFPVTRSLPHGTSLSFDGYVHRGAPIIDVITGGPDDRWFHIAKGSGYGWVASALVNGNPNF